VNCFTAFHCRGALSNSKKALLDVIIESYRKPTLGNPSKFAPMSIQNLSLPLEKPLECPRALIHTAANKQENE